MRIRDWVYIILNLIATITYFIAFFTKNMFFLGFGGCLLILNSICSITFDIIEKKKKSGMTNS